MRNSRLSADRIQALVLPAIIGIGIAVSAYIWSLGVPEQHRTRALLLQQEISSARETVSRIEQAPLLQPAAYYWEKVIGLADMYGVEMMPLDRGIEPPYQGPVQAWHWVLRGELADIAVMLGDAQSIAPVYVGKMAYQAGRATVSISILGT
jgi:hypothetical protein